MSQDRVSVRQEGEGHSMLRHQRQKSCAKTNNGESGVRNLEAENIRSRVDSIRGCVGRVGKVGDVHRVIIYSRECLSCTAFFLDWRPLERLWRVLPFV